VKTRRPITKFNRIIFQGSRNEGEHPHRSVESQSPSEIDVDVSVQLNVDYDFDEYSHPWFNPNELTIETDQNLQKYFVVESDEETLRIQLNSIDGAKIIPSSRIKITIRTNIHSIDLTKVDFNGRLNINMVNAAAASNDNDDDSIRTIDLSCSSGGQIRVDGNSLNNTNSVFHRANYLGHYYNNTIYCRIGFCDESFRLFLSQRKDYALVFASKNTSN
jgi:DUF4097 and DUF4098 domain-containing protein YvlB